MVLVMFLSGSRSVSVVLSGSQWFSVGLVGYLSCSRRFSMILCGSSCRFS